MVCSREGGELSLDKMERGRLWDESERRSHVGGKNMGMRKIKPLVLKLKSNKIMRNMKIFWKMRLKI